MSQLHKISPTCDHPERKADVIFIHGLGGDAFKTWRHGSDQSTSWPHWLADEFPKVRVWSLGYAASPSRWPALLKIFSRGPNRSGQGMALSNRAGQVLDLFALREIGHRPLLLIGHSLGGLLIKQILRSASDSTEERYRRVIDQTRGVLFLATPHNGAELAKLADTFRAIFNPTVTLTELKEHDANLQNLFDWYRNKAGSAGIETRTFYETIPVKGVMIVNPTSSHPGVGSNPVAIDEDHISIAKPADRDHQVYLNARDMLRTLLQPAPQKVKSPGGRRSFTM